MSDLTLYIHPGSTNSYKCTLLLSLLEVSCECVVLPFGTARERAQWFLQINPRGLVPVLKAGNDYYWDSTAILTLVGHRFGAGQWLPVGASGLARVMQWLALAQSEILHGIVRVRHIRRGSRNGDAGEAKALGAVALDMLERQLASAPWLVGSHPTIADIACYPHVARAGESGYAMEGYPAVSAWRQRIEELPRWVPRLTSIDDPIAAGLYARRPWQ